MVTEIKYQAATKLTPREHRRIEDLVKSGYFLNISDFLRAAVRDKIEAMKPVLVRKIGPAAAKKEVHQYIKNHPGAYPDDIAEALNLDLETVMDAVGGLLGEKKIGEFE